jgi:hypothetical protein
LAAGLGIFPALPVTTPRAGHRLRSYERLPLLAGLAAVRGIALRRG